MTLTELNEKTPQSSKFAEQVKRHPLFFYFLIAYLFSWILSIPFILSEWGIIRANMSAFFVIKGFGPFVSALILTRLLEGKEGVTRLRKKIKQTKAGWLMYAFLLVGIPLMIMLGVLVQPGTTQGFQGFKVYMPITYLFTYVVVIFGGGPLGEEPGWRGFALPRLQQKHGPLVGTLILGVLWTCWHLPDFLTSAQGGGPGTGFSAFLANFPVFLLLVTFMAILMTWIYNHTQGSVFMTLLAHASINTPQVVLMPAFPAVDTTKLNLAALISFGAAALIVLILTRARLGYQPSSAVPETQSL